MKRTTIFGLLILVILISSCSSIEGPFLVENVVDGDTLDVHERVRLSGINTPERGECYYKEATERLEELTLNKEVFLERDKSNRGNYGRLLRYVYVDEVLVNKVLVEEGYAKVYDKYKDDTKRYKELKLSENIAKANNLGVWNC